MPNEFCSVLISATSKEEADKIADVLLEKRLIAGAIITNGPSKYWRKGEIAKKEYYNVQAFSLLINKKKIIDEVEEVHSDKCPIIAFLKMDGSEAFLNWITSELNSPRKALAFMGAVLRKKRSGAFLQLQ